MVGKARGLGCNAGGKGEGERTMLTVTEANRIFERLGLKDQTARAGEPVGTHFAALINAIIDRIEALEVEKANLDPRDVIL